MIYCDTSLLVSALLFSEPRSHAAQIWLADHSADGLAISAWVQTEFASAIALRARRRDLDDAAKARVLRTWAVLLSSFEPLRLEQRHFEAAAGYVLEAGSRLRAGDALHLAVALDHHCTLATLDRDLDDEAVRRGISEKLLAGDA